MKVTIKLTKQEAIESLLQFYKHISASEIIISDDEHVETDDGWISNIGNDTKGHPDSISSNTFIEVKYHNGKTAAGYAGNWLSTWKETDKSEHGIAAYRILKD
jgi:hypothetical protein